MRTATNNTTIDPTNKMTSTTNKMTTSQLLADLHTGQTKIASAAESYKAALTEKQAAFKSFQANPAAVPVSEAVRIISELNGLQELTETFNPQLVDFLQRQLADQTFISRKDEFVLASNSELDAALVPQPSYVAKLTKWLSELPSRIYAPTVTVEEREKLLAERDKKEDAAEALASAIVNARAAISRFSATPSPECFGGVQSAISFVKSALA